MKKDDNILRYLSDYMSEDERNSFEKELSLSEDLREQVALQRSILNGINDLADIKEESGYFQNLLPRVRAKIDKKKSTIWAPKWAYALATSTAVILIAINIGKFNSTANPVKNEIKSEAAVQAKSEVAEIYEDYNLLSENYVSESSKNNVSTFEVGIGDISNKEIIKEIAATRIAYPVEEYLLALK